MTEPTLPPGVRISIAIVDRKKVIIFIYENIKKSTFDKTDFPALLGVEIVELEEEMFALLSLALT
jgi:hypothetical protein